MAAKTLGNHPFRWVDHHHSGPGSAVREGVFLSRGHVILIGNLECHYDADFFRKALAKLRSGRTGVVANRRLPDSEFTVPVTSLSLLYRRHLLGVLVGRIWSLIFRLPLTDNLSGAFVLKRDFALKTFNRLTCPGFLYEVEMALVAKVNGARISDLPAAFFLEREKPRLRVYQEIGSVLRWTWKFLWSLRWGDYGFLRSQGQLLTADDWGISPAVNDGILELARTGGLHRVSILAFGRFADYRLAELKRVPGIEFGLHFNLTYPEGGSLFRSLPDLLRAWYGKRGREKNELLARVRSALSDQLSFLERRGIRPKGLEGHHHVQILPGMLEGIQDILHARGIRRIRIPYHPSLWLGKKLPLAWWGKSLGPIAHRLGFASDPFYYPAPSDLSSFNRLVRCLNRVRGSEVLVHPAVDNDIPQVAPSDGDGRWRVAEYSLLRLLALERIPWH
jgi:predicted glycoside hydrolase/deacetylase ChbG (UPF0249 family)